MTTNWLKSMGIVSQPPTKRPRRRLATVRPAPVKVARTTGRKRVAKVR
jgi:hypothetical protein